MNAPIDAVGIRHACPSVRAPMRSGDGLLARVTPRAATLTASDAESLDGLACRYGNGTIEITGRGNLQVRGLRDDSAGPFAAALARLGLDGPHIGAAPLLARDAAALALYDRLDRLVAAIPGRAPKFSLHVEAGPVPSGGIRCDIRVRLGRTAADTRIEAGGLSASGPPDAAAELARLLAPHRASTTDRRTLEAMFSASGLDPSPGREEPADDPDPLGATPEGCVGVAPPFGAFGPGAFGRLARLAADRGDGALRLASRTILLDGVADPASVRTAAVADGLVTDAADPRRRLVACAGAPSCAAGLAPARANAERLLALVPAAGTLHVSGCAKGCAHPAEAALVLVGLRGGSYRIARDSRAELPADR